MDKVLHTVDVSLWLCRAGAVCVYFCLESKAWVLQEIVPLNASNIMMGASAEAATSWDVLIDTALNADDE